VTKKTKKTLDELKSYIMQKNTTICVLCSRPRSNYFENMLLAPYSEEV